MPLGHATRVQTSSVRPLAPPFWRGHVYGRDALQGKVFWEMEVKSVQVHRPQAWGAGLRMEDRSQRPTRQGPRSDRDGRASGCSLGAPVVAPTSAHPRAPTALQQVRMERLVSRRS